MKKPIFTLMLLLGISSSVAAAASRPEAVELPTGKAAIVLDAQVSQLRDEPGKWTLDDVRTAALSSQFKANKTAAISNGFTDAVYWYRFTLRVPPDHGDLAAWVLELTCPWLDYVDFYLVRSDGRIEAIETGDLRPAAPQQISHPSFAIPLQMAPGEQDLTVYLRVKTQDAHQFSLMVSSNKVFLASTGAMGLWYGIILGVLLVMAVYNLILFFWVRDRVFLYYSVYVLSVWLNAVLLVGFARQYFSGLAAEAPLWIHAAPPWVLILMSFSGTLFAAEFIKARQHAPRLYRLFQLGFALYAIGFVLTPFISMNSSIQIGLALLALQPVLCLTGSVYLASQGIRSARLYLLAFSVVLVSAILFVLASFGVIVANQYTLNAWQIGVPLDILLLSLALADRINIERRQKFEAIGNTARLKSFLPERVAELVLLDRDKNLLAPKRRQVTVCIIDLRGFTPFSELAEPEEVMAVLKDFFGAMGEIVERHGGTVEHFAGDSMLIFYNAPLEIPDPEKQAVKTALEMQQVFVSLRAQWLEIGYELGLGIGIANGQATIGAIGFLGRSQYAAIGTPSNLASRLCSLAAHGEILTTRRVATAAGSNIEVEAIGEKTIKGFQRPIPVVRVQGQRL